MKVSKMASMTLALVMISSFGFTTSAEAAETFQGAGEPVSEVLSTLKVRPQSRKPSDRSNHTWNHVEGKKGSYSTRDLILDRDLTDVSYKSNGRVKEGDFVDPYTGTSFKFESGTGRQHDGGIQIDHVVAYAEAYNSGLKDKSSAVRDAYYNDPYVLLASKGTANQEKGDSDAAEWLPSNTSFHCEYVARQVGIKAKYGLSVDPEEKEAISNVLESCPSEKVPTEGGVSKQGKEALDAEQDQPTGILRSLWSFIKEKAVSLFD